MSLQVASQEETQRNNEDVTENILILCMILASPSGQTYLDASGYVGLKA